MEKLLPSSVVLCLHKTDTLHGTKLLCTTMYARKPIMEKRPLKVDEQEIGYTVWILRADTCVSK